MDRLFLLIDADDTLWENSVYFEEAIDRFIDLLDHPELTPSEVRRALDGIELENIEERGYGSKNFGRNLDECFLRLGGPGASAEDRRAVKRLADGIAQQPIELLDGVVETLEYLSRRHHLTLFSKGDPEEQLTKFERSALKPFFHNWRIVREKNAAAYRLLVREEGMAPEKTWMAGNSPKSDIHPALEAGLRAVYVPHERTWTLERRKLPEESERFLIVERFSDLGDLF